MTEATATMDVRTPSPSASIIDIRGRGDRRAATGR